VSDGVEGGECDVALAALDSADIGPVEAAFFGANLLRPFSFEAEAAQVLGYYFCRGLICHRGKLYAPMMTL
jgi:hypothetical protein